MTRNRKKVLGMGFYVAPNSKALYYLQNCDFYRQKFDSSALSAVQRHFLHG